MYVGNWATLELRHLEKSKLRLLQLSSKSKSPYLISPNLWEELKHVVCAGLHPAFPSEQCMHWHYTPETVLFKVGCHIPAVESTFSQAAAPPRTSSTSFNFGYFLLFTCTRDKTCHSSGIYAHVKPAALFWKQPWLKIWLGSDIMCIVIVCLTFLVMLCTYGQVLQANLMHFCPSSTIKTFPQVGQKSSMLVKKCMHLKL